MEGQFRRAYRLLSFHGFDAFLDQEFGYSVTQQIIPKAITVQTGSTCPISK